MVLLTFYSPPSFLQSAPVFQPSLFWSERYLPTAITPPDTSDAPFPHSPPLLMLAVDVGAFQLPWNMEVWLLSDFAGGFLSLLDPSYRPSIPSEELPTTPLNLFCLSRRPLSGPPFPPRLSSGRASTIAVSSRLPLFSLLSSAYIFFFIRLFLSSTNF